MKYPRAITAEPQSQIAGRLFIIACALGIAVGVVASVGMLLAATAFATASTIAIPLVATFEGFHDAGGTNAVTVTGSWAAAGVATAVMAAFVSFLVLRNSQRRPTPMHERDPRRAAARTPNAAES